MRGASHGEVGAHIEVVGDEAAAILLVVGVRIGRITFRTFLTGTGIARERAVGPVKATVRRLLYRTAAAGGKVRAIEMIMHDCSKKKILGKNRADRGWRHDILRFLSEGEEIIGVIGVIRVIRVIGVIRVIRVIRIIRGIGRIGVIRIIGGIGRIGVIRIIGG